MPDREKVIREWEAVLSRDPFDAPWDLIDDTVTLLKEQGERIKLLEYQLKTLTMTHDFEEDRLFQSGYVKGYHDAVMKCPDIVRCKDCGYSLFKEGVVPPEHIVCTKPFTERWQVVKPDNWFCADGERRS